MAHSQLMYPIHNNVNITVSPSPALVDDDVKIRIECLHPGEEVTLMCRVQEQGVRFFSWAYYRSDENGIVDVTTMPALPGGRYDGVEPMGFVWSQVQEPGQQPGRRLVKQNVTTPLITELYVLDGRMAPDEGLQSINGGHWLTRALLERNYMADGVKRVEVREGRLIGTLFIPPGEGPYPGVIDLFGTVGGIVEHRSAMLASRGIASFAVCYFTPGRGEGLITAIEYFEEAIFYLLRHPQVRKPYVGIIGVSKGAELALLISSLCHQIRACVEINGIDVVTLVDTTYKGRLFPFYYNDVETVERLDGGLSFKNIYKNMSPEEYQKHSIPVELGQCDYLLIHSGDDQSVPPLAAERIPKRLQDHHKSNYQVLLYPNAGHLIEPPHSPHFYATYHGLFSDISLWGGKPRSHARAQEDAWKQVLHFFKTKLDSKVQYLPNKL